MGSAISIVSIIIWDLLSLQIGLLSEGRLMVEEGMRRGSTYRAIPYLVFGVVSYAVLWQGPYIIQKSKYPKEGNRI